MTSNIQTLMDLGWSDFYAQQFVSDETNQIIPMRISSVHRVRLNALAEDGAHILFPQAQQSTGDFAVGDWVLADHESGQIHRILQQKTVLKRYASDQTVAAS
ncbi:MAG: hypothetical protein JKX94_02150 [Sneathiella sp.]|nr:hypothetical protein [Sneathiella sp.]